ncbi:flagellar basal body P-ring formation chaperone FlgA [Ancylobacter sp. SL191]|uniref:flagellar basal body P-ring formation chaperone FlgA n=1 Tax=Ancylobacter sp. SL191 TaxID=2995166 RepID=UPI0022722350|nr:flagellar basal body P-ring formation chaperone FlgA [Ancylobacter sp. SL191]WAC29027.1 flagellar basal body P-ring formation chaperone FlgA [Ancylobacter sp. SL191]
MRRHFGGAARARALSHALARIGVLALGSLAFAGGALAASIADSRVDSSALADWAPPTGAAPATPPVAGAPLPQQVMLPVAATTVAPGETITDAMLVDKSFPAHVTSEYPIAVNRGQLVGKVARRVLLAGNAVPVGAVGEAKVVTRGVATELRFEQGGLLITAMGVPLDSATVGAMVRLKNVDSGKIVTGIVQADGSVKVGGK